jgi:hypothetical protein
MPIKTISFLFFGLIIFTSIDAQKVKRKGVDPIDVSKSKNTKSNIPVFTIDQLLGKWQEVARVEKPNTQVSFTDTIFLHFTALDAVTTKQGNQLTYKGNAEIATPGNILLAAADVYTILSISADTVVLDNQENFIHTLKKAY